MGFNLKTYVCETCGHTFMGEKGLIIKCNKENCERKNSDKKELKENAITQPKKDIRVGGC